MVLFEVLGSVYFRFAVRFNILCGAVLHSLWCGLACFVYVEQRCDRVDFRY